MKRSIMERSVSCSTGASSRMSLVLSAARERTTSTARPVSLRDLLVGGLPAEVLPQRFRGAGDPREIGGAVERHPDGAALAGQRREDGLADPPDSVGDELHALVGIELPGCGKQTQVALADQVAQAHAPVLVFLGDGDDEAQIALDQLLHRLGVAGLDQAGNRGLLLAGSAVGSCSPRRDTDRGCPDRHRTRRDSWRPVSRVRRGLAGLGLGENIGGREVRNRVGKRLVIHRDKITLHHARLAVVAGHGASLTHFRARDTFPCLPRCRSKAGQ